ncbi:MAG: DegT/DnrJ/EryC1/StrS family aminotransferase [Betaproteobacteria bacterium]|nr:DegT/DnrJ/EryC1/StrS family aminotransferase [Betaproteobacteria bacterium]
MTRYIPQMEPLVTEGDARAVNEYLASGGWLTEFTQTRLFEKSICQYTGARFCSIAPSGTLALFLALKACDIGRDDEVIVPDLTMAATATAVMLAGGKVVFADIDATTLCLDLDRAGNLISERTKAVIFVSLNGRSPQGLGEFVARCRRRGVKVIEDAAQSLGSFEAGRHLGTIGDCGCFSFSSQKIITTGQGGAAVTNDEQIHKKMSLLRDFGRLEGGSDHYLSIGWNLKFTDLQAAIGLSQMSRLAEIVDRKKSLYGLYRECLSGVKGIEIPMTDLTNVTPWFVDVLIDKDLKPPLMKHLHENGVGSRDFYPALHAEPAFATAGTFPVAEAVSGRGLWLPSSLRLEDDEVRRVCHLVLQFFAG